MLCSKYRSGFVTVTHTALFESLYLHHVFRQFKLLPDVNLDPIRLVTDQYFSIDSIIILNTGRSIASLLALQVSILPEPKALDLGQLYQSS
jgi:hypothetical protein